MAILQSWQVASARVVLHRAERGEESIRETCPSTQIWLLLSGEWQETGDGSRGRVERYDVRRYAPKQPNRRVVESDSTAIGIELFKVSGAPVLSPQQLRTSWQIAHLALNNRLDYLYLEEQVGSFEGQTRPAERSADWLQHAFEIVQAEYRDPLTLDGIASRVGISPNHLSASFHAAHGLPISKLIRRLRLEDSLRRLDSTPDAWLDAGFYDVSHFWRACKTDLGLTPSQIRRLRS
jgi:AraC-like DNA-binding protein